MRFKLLWLMGIPFFFAGCSESIKGLHKFVENFKCTKADFQTLSQTVEPHLKELEGKSIDDDGLLNDLWSLNNKISLKKSDSSGDEPNICPVAVVRKCADQYRVAGFLTHSDVFATKSVRSYHGAITPFGIKLETTSEAMGQGLSTRHKTTFENADKFRKMVNCYEEAL